MRRNWVLAGQVNGLCEAESEAAALLQVNDGDRSVTTGARKVAQVAPGKEARSLDGQFPTGDIDRIEDQANVAAIARRFEGERGLHAASDGGAARNEDIPVDHQRFVHYCLEGA